MNFIFLFSLAWHFARLARFLKTYCTTSYKLQHSCYTDCSLSSAVSLHSSETQTTGKIDFRLPQSSPAYCMILLKSVEGIMPISLLWLYFTLCTVAICLNMSRLTKMWIETSMKQHFFTIVQSLGVCTIITTASFESFLNTISTQCSSLVLAPCRIVLSSILRVQLSFAIPVNLIILKSARYNTSTSKMGIRIRHITFILRNYTQPIIVINLQCTNSRIKEQQWKTGTYGNS